MNRFELFTFLIASISKSIYRIKADFMEESGLKSSHVHLLYYLYARGTLTVTELARLSLDDKANISRTAVTLEERGLVLRTLRGRRAMLSLTEEGRLLGEHIQAEIDRVLLVSARGLSEEEQTAMYSALKKVDENLLSYYSSDETNNGGKNE